MKIVGICGILDFADDGDTNSFWKHFKDAFREQYPDATFVAERIFYLPWQGKKMRRFADEIVRTHDTGEELMLFGHSLGGVIACAIAPRFVKSSIRAVVTVNAPHRLSIFYKLLHVTRPRLQTPVLTFAGIFDPLVPWFISSYPGNTHKNIVADHLYSFLWGTRSSQKIARTVQNALGSISSEA